MAMATVSRINEIPFSEIPMKMSFRPISGHPEQEMDTS